ncbi:MAG: type IV toxin-antitoxin system AbiEi family antitoxin domain-containing protein, partial [Candidatus Microthrix sp.]|nr:type IV toxin-antitoxin system AbiEi family antitoxin domain-containing protein [Candidatus Microthrix sp.]
MAGIDVVIAELGERQAGTMSRQQLLDSGIGAKMVHRSVERGRLIRLHRGVYRVPGAPVTRLQGLWAAHLFAGPGSVASHGSAGYLWRLEAV